MKTIFFTKKGDNGKSLIGKKNLPKDNLLFEFLGEVDELNCWLGLCRAELKNKNYQRFNNKKININKLILDLQDILFIIQAEISAMLVGRKSSKKITSDKIEFLEKNIYQIDNLIPKINKFIVAGESELSARVDLARAVSRKVERLGVKLSRKCKLSKDMLKFLNRLSSFLFALGRYINFTLKLKEKNPTYK